MSSELRVAIVIGGRFHAFDLARELDRRGVLQRLIVNYPKFKTREWALPDSRVVSLPLTLGVQKLAQRLGEPSFQQIIPYLHRCFGAHAARHLEGATLVHGWSGFSLPSFQWARRHQAACVVERGSAHILTQHEILDEEHARLRLTWSRAHPAVIERELEEYAMADLIAVPSLFVKRTFIKRGIPEERLLHSPFGANVKSFVPGQKRDSVFRVVFAGQLSVRKGIHYLVQAFNEAAIQNSELSLIGGQTSQTPVLLREADARVRLVGHIPQAELVRHYQQASVFAIASIEEGLAMVQAQALASGLPLICTSSTGGEDLLRMSGPLIQAHEGGVDEYPAGYVVPARDAAAIARCLRWLAEDASLLQAKREAAIAFRATGLDWKAYADRVVAGYARIRR